MAVEVQDCKPSGWVETALRSMGDEASNWALKSLSEHTALDVVDRAWADIRKKPKEVFAKWTADIKLEKVLGLRELTMAAAAYAVRLPG